MPHQAFIFRLLSSFKLKTSYSSSYSLTFISKRLIYKYSHGCQAGRGSPKKGYCMRLSHAKTLVWGGGGDKGRTPFQSRTLFWKYLKLLY